MGPCAKQTVTATIICTDGQRFVGTNDCERPQETCPRADMPTGVGYELCRDVCGQHHHAEANAVFAAGRAARGATLYLQGHMYVCANCETYCRMFGVQHFVIGPPPPQGNVL